MAFQFADEDVPIDYIVDKFAIGGEGGERFTFIRLDEGARLEKIQAWSTTWCVRGVQVWMSDESNYTVGECTGEHTAEFIFEEGEIIAELKLNAAEKARLGGISIKTNRGREWSILSDQTSAYIYTPKVGSGICCGIFGAGGVDVDRLGFAMLRKIKSVVMTNVTYPNMAKQIVPTTPETVAHQEFSNDTYIEQTFEMSGTRTVTTTREWSLSMTLSFGVSVEVSAGIPEVVSVGAKTEWSIGSTSSYSQSSTHTEEKSWTWELKCPPNRKIVGDATMFADNISTDYVADMMLCFDNGKVKTYQEKGMYKGLNARYGKLTIEDLGPYPEIKKARYTALVKRSANAKILAIQPFLTTKEKLKRFPKDH